MNTVIDGAWQQKSEISNLFQLTCILSFVKWMIQHLALACRLFSCMYPHMLEWRQKQACCKWLESLVRREEFLSSVMYLFDTSLAQQQYNDSEFIKHRSKSDENEWVGLIKWEGTLLPSFYLQYWLILYAQTIFQCQNKWQTSKQTARFQVTDTCQKLKKCSSRPAEGE